MHGTAQAKVRVRAGVLAAMREQARLRLPEECCGLLAGAAEVVTELIPASNALASSRAYFIDPIELIGAFRALRERGLRHLGIYHSHPTGPNFPSPRDVEMAYYPACAYFILSPVAAFDLQIRAFTICNGRVEELKVEPAAG
ncbi:MAG: M67 family metallopeptidase [Terriglobia bacterium]